MGGRGGEEGGQKRMLWVEKNRKIYWRGGRLLGIDSLEYLDQTNTKRVFPN